MSQDFTIYVDNGRQYLSEHSAAITISAPNSLAAGTYEIKYDWASVMDSALTSEELTQQAYITVSLGAAAKALITISSEGRYGDGTGYVYVCVPALSSQVKRSEMNLTTLYGIDSTYYNIAYQYGTFGHTNDGESAYPLFISSSKVANGAWPAKKPSTLGVRQTHPSYTSPVTITQTLTPDQYNDIHHCMAAALAGSVAGGDHSFVYLNPDQPWRNHWTVVDAEQRKYARTFTSIEEVLTDSENGQNFQDATSDYLVTETGRAYLQAQLKSAVLTAGFGTRAAVVAAAQYLAAAFPYDINYVSGVGGIYYEGVAEISGTSKKMLIYQDGLNIESDTTGWGCSDDSLFQITQNKVENPAKTHGLNCSGFVYWAMYNAGFDLSNDMEHILAFYQSRSANFNKSRSELKIMAAYLGRWIGGAEASDQNSFNLTGTKDVVHSYHPTWNDARKALRSGIQPGDLVSVTRRGEHIGMVLEVTDEYIYTVDSIEHQNDYALCYNGGDSRNEAKACSSRVDKQNPNIIHSGIYIRKFAADHAQEFWERVVSMDYVYHNAQLKRTGSEFYGVALNSVR
jgi:hypothetical protein